MRCWGKRAALKKRFKMGTYSKINKTYSIPVGFRFCSSTATNYMSSFFVLKRKQITSIHVGAHPGAYLWASTYGLKIFKHSLAILKEWLHVFCLIFWCKKRCAFPVPISKMKPAYHTSNINNCSLQVQKDIIKELFLRFKCCMC